MKFLREFFSKVSAPKVRPVTEHLAGVPLSPYFFRLPVPDWEGLARNLGPRIETSPDATQDEIWCEIGRFWLSRLQEHLGEERFHLLESYDCLFLHCLPPRRAELLLKNTESILKRMRSLLGGNALESGLHGPHILVCFEECEEFLEYLSEFEPDGESATPGAVFIPGGPGHMALYGHNLGMLEPSLVHELTHALLWHRGLPLWFEEGVAQVLPQLVVRSQGLEINAKLQLKQREIWTRYGGLRSFWDGTAFRHTEQSESAYQLAEVLVCSMLDQRLNLPGFLAVATWTDCGQAAARLAFDRELVSLARDFLGSDVPGLEPPAAV